MKISNIHFFEKIIKEKNQIKYPKTMIILLIKVSHILIIKIKILKIDDFKNINDISKYNTINKFRK